MATAFEDLRVLQTAEAMADDIWRRVSTWDAFARDTLGSQFVRAADSIGANLAESFGRFNYGEKIQFLYYARGSLFETRYWLDRALKRGLLPPDRIQSYSSPLAALGRQLNAFVGSLKAQRHEKSPVNVMREQSPVYVAESLNSLSPTDGLFTPQELDWLSSIVE